MHIDPKLDQAMRITFLINYSIIHKMKLSKMHSSSPNQSSQLASTSAFSHCVRSHKSHILQRLDDYGRYKLSKSMVCVELSVSVPHVTDS